MEQLSSTILELKWQQESEVKMENVRKLLDTVKEKAGVTTDYALAKILDLPRPRIHDYYKGNRTPDEYACLKISEILNKPLDQVIATVKADTEKDEKRRNEWLKVLKRLGGIAASFVVITFAFVTLIMTFPNQALASTGFAGSKSPVIQIMRTRIRKAALALDKLKTAFLRVYYAY